MLPLFYTAIYADARGTFNNYVDIVLPFFAHLSTNLYLPVRDIKKRNQYLAHVIEQPNLRIPNPQYLQQNSCFDFFYDSENTF